MMYNRYIPQSDGSFRRSQIPDAAPEPSRQPQQRESPRPREPECQPESGHKEEPPVKKNQPSAHMRQPRSNYQSSPPPRQQRSPQRTEKKDFGIGNFLRQLLPNDFDTEDLLIVLLLLLMSGDCREDQNTALLTLAIYLFM